MVPLRNARTRQGRRLANPHRPPRGAAFLPRVPEGRGQGVTCLTAVVARASTMGRGPLATEFRLQSTTIGPGPLAFLQSLVQSAHRICNLRRNAPRAARWSAARARVCVPEHVRATASPSPTLAACSRFYFYHFFFCEKAFPQPAHYSASSAASNP